MTTGHLPAVDALPLDELLTGRHTALARAVARVADDARNGRETLAAHGSSPASQDAPEAATTP